MTWDRYKFCPCCGLSGHPTTWICDLRCPDYPFRRVRPHLHVRCHLCECGWIIARNGLVMLVKIYFLQYKLLGMPESEVLEYEHPGTQATVAAKINDRFAGLLEEVKTWTEEREVVGSSSSEQPARDPASQLKDATTEIAALKKRLSSYERPDSGM